MSDAMIELEGVSKVYPGMDGAAVDDLRLTVPEGDIVVLVGPSGCGKTTTLRMINRLTEPTAGRITVDGRDVRSMRVHELRRGIGYVIQQIGLFPHRTIAENIATVPRLLGWEDARTRERVDGLIDTVGLEVSMRDRYPSELSGGQRQRVGVARALAADPPVLLMDEPFGAVDPIVRARLQDELLTLQSEVRKTIVFVTHDIDEAIHLGDRIAILNVGGVLEQYAPPEEVLREPASEFVEDFLGVERGLKRLALVRVEDIDLPSGPVVDGDATAEDARRVMKRERVHWVGVLTGRRLDGWVWEDDLVAGRRLDDHQLREFRVWVHCSATLREALDAIVGSRNQVAMIEDDDGFAGMLFLDQLTAELVA